MDNNEIYEATQCDFLKNVSGVLPWVQKNTKTVVNHAMLYTYLTSIVGKIYFAENLKLMWWFYIIFLHDQIGKIVFTSLDNLLTVSMRRDFFSKKRIVADNGGEDD